jgi:hypothetical protein
MAPLGILPDTRDAMAVARVLTALVAALNAALAAFAVRELGRVAMLVAGLGLAVFPSAVSADHTLTLDPYLVLFCLLGTVVMFCGSELATPRRILLAGALFGLAGAVKAWALFPVIAALCACIPLWASAVRPLLSGLVLGFGVPSLPFFLLAPRSFFHDVVTAQLNRSTTGQGYHSVGERLAFILGVGTPANVSTRVHLAWVVALILVAFALAVYFIAAPTCSRLEWFVLGGTAVVVTAMLFIVKEFYDYYSYFTAAFAAMLLGICIGRLAEGVRWAGTRIGGSAERTLALAAGIGFPALVVIAAALVVPNDASYARSFLRGAYDPRKIITSQIPKGACVVFDEAGNLTDSNRFFSSRPGCPPLVDAFGLWLTENNGIAPPAAPHSETFVAKWRSWLGRADYAVLAAPQSDYLPWTNDLVSWFNSNYRLVASESRVYVYKHVTGFD